ncbi:hypothetical protein COCNU_01G003070 [Cocos nucifera]|uniref:AAA+ ATPase domain-containing protein n=1 Tax=Cocos nucifera TaxID=13894 RepID=A0A8K0HUG4_COCNU|nr:hypothetical protein COCNU_01G003070 [Cocos nucifera]
MRPATAPLSERMRPATLDAVLGQDHLLGPASLLRSALRPPATAAAALPSFILWGPPGSGKTSLARALAVALPQPSHRFVPLSAVTAGVRDLRDAVDAARRARPLGRRTVLFVDEIHRFSKSQQDSFLPAIEDGSIILVGATTENPSFHLTTPPLSRCRVLALHPLKPHHVKALLRRAVSDPEKGLQVTIRVPISVDQEALEFLSLHCDGDARVALNALEIAATLAVDRRSSEDDSGNITVTVDHAKEAMQCKHLAYDRAGEEHYNLISALHKSMRGSDPDAAIYWLARMLEGGEQPLYIARRLVRFASEDVGLADPAALGHAVACYQACHFIGMPECDVCLAQCVAYLARAPKSVAVYRALNEARRVVKESGGGRPLRYCRPRHCPSLRADASRHCPSLRAHAACHPGRRPRPGPPPRPRLPPSLRPPPPRYRRRRPPFLHTLGPSGLRQDLPRPRPRRCPPPAVPSLRPPLRRHRRRPRPPRRRRRRPPGPPPRSPHRPLRRRDPPLLQVPAGLLPPRHRGRLYHPRRSHHREPLLPPHDPAPLPLPSPRPAPPQAPPRQGPAPPSRLRP